MERPSLGAPWDQWLVYADWLTEHGDTRGELLVLEAQVATAPAEARLDLEERLASWLDECESRLSDEDDDLVFDYLRCRRGFARFESIPPKLASVLEVPTSRLLANLVIDGDLDAPPSTLLEAHTRNIHEATSAWIDEAFDGVPVPEEGHNTLYQAEAEDHYRTSDRARDHLGRWQDLPEQHLLDCQWALAFLDEQGIQYYIPAVMCFDLRYSFQSPDSWLTESLAYTLVPTGGLLERFQVLSYQQRAAVCAFCLVSNNDDAFSAWIRVIEAEKDGPIDNWFAVWTQGQP